MNHAEIFHEILEECHSSIEKHGSWDGLSNQSQAAVIREEYREWQAAYFGGDVDGEHGEIKEAIQLINVLMKRIMMLTREG
jgi:hypothetical protein